MSREIRGVNGREKVLMALFDEGWRWWVHEYDEPDKVVYRSDPFPAPGECEEDVEEKAALFRDRMLEPVTYEHDGKWHWQYRSRENEILLRAGPFDAYEDASGHHGWMNDLLLCWGGPEDDE